MKSYKVKSGDSLGSIAMKFLGETSRWREIAELNDIANPNRISVGQVLQLPVESEPESSTRESDVVIIEEGKLVYYRHHDDAVKHRLGKKFKKGTEIWQFRKDK